jgi:hypothetical protein
MVSPPTLLRITPHATPHKSDPPNAHEFYAALGKLIIAWGRLEGHNHRRTTDDPCVTGSVKFRRASRKELWERAFDKIPPLKAHQARATDFIAKIVQKFCRACDLPQRRHPNTIKIMDVDVSRSKIKQALTS